MRTEIIQKIELNRISTTEVADCLGKSGALKGVSAVNRGHFRVGPVYWTYAFNASNWELHEQLQHPPPHSVVVVDCIDCDGRAPLGSLVCKFLFLYRQVRALVVLGPIRDAPHIIKENWPVWCTGFTPIGCFNRQGSQACDPEQLARSRTQFHDAVAVCDDSGVVIIPTAEHTAGFLDKLDWIEQQEDVWFACIDQKKWTTFDAVCLRRYERDGG